MITITSFTPDSSQLVTLSPGTFRIVETAGFTIINPTFSGDCMQTAPGSTEATRTISVGQHVTVSVPVLSQVTGPTGNADIQ